MLCMDTYVHLGKSLDPTDPVFIALDAKLGVMNAKEQQLSAFADPEIYALPMEKRREIFSDPLFDDYRYALRAYIDPKAQPLGEEANTVLATVSMGTGYAQKIYNVLQLEMPYPIITMPDGTEAELTNAVYNDIVHSDEYDDDFKAEANQLLLTRPKPFIHTMAKLLEEKVAQTYALALMNHYDTTREAKMDTYDLDPAIYDMLIEAAHDGASDYQRFFRAHARGLGLEEQRPYNTGTYVSDFNPGKMEYEDAVAEVIDALSVLGDEYIDTFKAIITGGHVDAYPSRTKKTTAFMTSPSDEYLPWVSFNYKGYSSDVSTIAHEMGHAVYTALIVTNQPKQNRGSTTFTQEVASTTNELLYYAYKMHNAADDDEKLYYLENVLYEFSNTFFNSMWYAEFEDYMYQLVESGSALDPEVLSDKWMELTNLYRGDAVVSYPDFRYQWTSIPHFFSPYYVYQYASSICYASSIAERIFSGEEGAVDDYLAFLKLGCSDSPQVLLSVAGIDPLSRETYQAAMKYYCDLVDEYERLVDAKLAEDKAD